MIPVRTWSPDPYMTGWKSVVERIAVDLRSDVRIRRAARMGQQARVVRLPARLPVDPEAVGKPHRDQRAVQAVLERDPMPRSVAKHRAATNSAPPDPLAARRPYG